MGSEKKPLGRHIKLIEPFETMRRSWEKIGKLGIGCEARQRMESLGEAQSMIPA